MIFRHQILDDGRVLVNLNGALAHLDPSAVKRFAWGVLNDLDPEEADASGYVAPVIVLSAAEARDHGPKRGPWQIMAMLSILALGPSYTTSISRGLGLDRTQTAIQLGRLEKRGWAVRLTQGRPHQAGKWGITNEGRIALGEYEDRLAA